MLRAAGFRRAAFVFSRTHGSLAQALQISVRVFEVRGEERSDFFVQVIVGALSAPLDSRIARAARNPAQRGGCRDADRDRGRNRPDALPRWIPPTGAPLRAHGRVTQTILVEAKDTGFGIYVTAGLVGAYLPAFVAGAPDSWNLPLSPSAKKKLRRCLRALLAVLAPLTSKRASLDLATRMRAR